MVFAAHSIRADATRRAAPQRRSNSGLPDVELAGAVKFRIVGETNGMRMIRFQIESRTCPGAILRGAHGKNTVLRRWKGIRRLSGCSGIGLKPYESDPGGQGSGPQLRHPGGDGWCRGAWHTGQAYWRRPPHRGQNTRLSCAGVTRPHPGQWEYAAAGVRCGTSWRCGAALRSVPGSRAASRPVDAHAQGGAALTGVAPKGRCLPGSNRWGRPGHGQS